MKDLVRTAVAAGLSALLHAGSRPYPFPSGRTLIVAPHADDETLGCGGLIAAKTARGTAVSVVILTDNRHSHPGHPHFAGPALGKLRRQETLAALHLLGVPAGAVHFLDAPDGRLAALDAGAHRALVDRLAALVQAVAPTEVFTPFLGGGSTEHDAAHWHARTALALAGSSAALWEYPVWAWWNPFRLRSRLLHRDGNFRLDLGPLLTLKRRALACHRTQTLPLPPWPHPALPPVLADLCCQPAEFFFRRPHP